MVHFVWPYTREMEFLDPFLALQKGVDEEKGHLYMWLSPLQFLIVVKYLAACTTSIFYNEESCMHDLITWGSRGHQIFREEGVLE